MTKQPLQISHFAVAGLFGVFNYDLAPQSGHEDVLILYGDNGSGKTTILKLIFHTLSAANDRGHRSAVAEVPFERMTLSLTNGYEFGAIKDPEYFNIVNFHLLQPDRDPISFRFNLDKRQALRLFDDPRFSKEFLMKEAVRLGFRDENAPTTNVARLIEEQDFLNSKNQQLYLQALSELELSVSFVSADRQIRSDEIDAASERIIFREISERLKVDRNQDTIAATRSAYVTKALDSAARWITNRVITGANIGTFNVNEIYKDIVKRIIRQPRKTSDVSQLVERRTILIEQLEDLRQRTEGYAEFGLTSSLQVNELTDILQDADAHSIETVEQILRPYFQGLRARLDALSEIYELIKILIQNLNLFLAYKTITFTISDGFIIKDKTGRHLNPEQLSSGEQQLLLLFSHALIARDLRSIFIVDEPEISLNIKWQRRLIASIQEVAKGRGQFIFATHSMELLAQHRDNVIQLRRTDTISGV